MEHQPSTGAEPRDGPDTIGTPEAPPRERPRIYVASLSDYNNGRLHGAWIDADQPPDDIAEKIKIMLAKSRYDPAEEWAVHDVDGLHGLHLSEYASVEHLAMLGQGIAEHGPAFAVWANLLGSERWTEELDDFEDCYLGAYASFEELGTEMADETGIEALLDEHLPEHIRPYVHVDYKAYGQDLAAGVERLTHDGCIYLFST